MKKNGSRLIIGWRQVPSAKSSHARRKPVTPAPVRKPLDGKAVAGTNADGQALPGLLEEEKT